MIKGLKMLVLAGAIVISSCVKVKTHSEKPFQPIDLGELASYEGRGVMVDGVPSSIEDNVFVLSNGNHYAYIKGDFRQDAMNIGRIPNYIREALEREAFDGDEEKVTIFGTCLRSELIEAKILTVEGKMYGISRVE